MARLRCAIYTRKSSEDGLEQEFNSLHAQYEACAAYVASQKHEGWELLPERFDDGGISGGHLDRPALRRLMAAVDDGRVDQIVVYKIDRLTRSLADFAKLVDRLDAAEASFVSVTQSFNTATSMGRLTLNMLLSFAQFEREVTAERIRDKIAASKRKGLWMGGNVPFGYDPDGRTLRVNAAEAATVRTLYELYRADGTLREVKARADDLGLRTRRRHRPDGRVTGGGAFDRGHIHHLLTNPIYAGRIRHKDRVFDGQHPAIIPPEVWEEVQTSLSDTAARPRGAARKVVRSPLAGKLFDETGDRLTPSHSRKNGKRLRYYISGRLVSDRSADHPDAWRLPAPALEELLDQILTQRLQRPDAAVTLTRGLGAADLARIAGRLANIALADKGVALIERVTLQPGSATIQLDAKALSSLIGCSPDQIAPDALSLTAPFTMRRRGVELKLHLGDTPAAVDHTLVANLVKARRWLDMILAGQSFTKIASVEGTSKRRVQDVIELALLAPDFLDAIADGTQPAGLTSDTLIKTGFPTDWAKQRRHFADL
jgi:DNA invertase Pin-like site-specific DNA recombinase